MFFEVSLNSLKLNARLVEFALGREAFRGKYVPRVPLPTVRVSGPPHAVGSTAANRLLSSFWALSPVFSASRAFYVLGRAKNFSGNHEFRSHLAQPNLQKIEKWKKWKNLRKKTNIRPPKDQQRKSKKQSAKIRQNRTPGKGEPRRGKMRKDGGDILWKLASVFGSSWVTEIGHFRGAGKIWRKFLLVFVQRGALWKRWSKHVPEFWFNMVAKFGSTWLPNLVQTWLPNFGKGGCKIAMRRG